MNTVSIRKNDYGFEWSVGNGRWYSIQLEQILPHRYRGMIVANCINGKCVTFTYGEYDRANKILLVENERIPK
jgi:hypothetical protein